MTSAITIEDINKLLGLFQELQALVKPDLPTKNNELWQQSLEEAERELAAKLKERQLRFTARPGCQIVPRKSSKAKKKEIHRQCEKRITEIAEKKYYEKDPAYAKVLDVIERKANDVLKNIDHLLLTIREPLLQFPRVENSLLAVDWKEHIRDYYRFLDKDNFSYQVQEAIDVLEALKLQFERQRSKEVEGGRHQDPTETERRGAINVEIAGDVHTGNLQIGHDGSIHKEMGTKDKKSGGVKKILKIIGASVGFLAALLTCIGYLLGWLEPIKAFIYRILWPK